MTLSNPDPATITAFEEWMKAQIAQLSVETLKSEAITCTACGEVSGTYIIDYKGDRFRFPTDRAYAFLKFIHESHHA
ncbi:hypothetical protein H6F43_17150 [Leptolyngbya sp. FACHB-36]|uniref:hypothetical protein n=1 Tax=Leptolyngbya sp. FACHB-36 TaxID=2692808 RepID=UPI001680FB61|nr:hypothetical protein [Leptolyngbya sp. FACHB-36]MBD2021910.1 hypothetical protein [Leptolyngbya sp. FACHB-36]